MLLLLLAELQQPPVQSAVFTMVIPKTSWQTWSWSRALLQRWKLDLSSADPMCPSFLSPTSKAGFLQLEVGLVLPHCSQSPEPCLPSWCQFRALFGLLCRKICLKGLHIPRNHND